MRSNERSRLVKKLDSPIIRPIQSYMGPGLSILEKVEKLIRHEVSARSLGSIAEADAFAAKVQRILVTHNIDRRPNIEAINPAATSAQHHRVTAEQAGISSLRTRQEWTERLASGIATAFHCELLLQSGSYAVIFRGREQDRTAAGSLYAYLAQSAMAACVEEFAQWRQRQRTNRWPDSASPAKTAAYSRRWKQSFLLGFSRAISQRFICDHGCHHKCQHSGGLVRIGLKSECAAKAVPGRAIGGIDVLYDALYRGQAYATHTVIDLGQQSAA